MAPIRNKKVAATTEEGESSSGSCSCNLSQRPYRKLPFPGRDERGWLETALRMGLMATPPQFCLAKTVTKSDADKNQHRYQLTGKDVNGAMPLQKIKARAMAVQSLHVNVLDRDGRKYVMDFKYIACNGYFRFMGDGWTEYLNNTKLKEKQIMSMWMLLPGSLKESDGGDYWFALLNSDESDIIE